MHDDEAWELASIADHPPVMPFFSKRSFEMARFEKQNFRGIPTW